MKMKMKQRHTHTYHDHRHRGRYYCCCVCRCCCRRRCRRRRRHFPVDTERNAVMCLHLAVFIKCIHLGNLYQAAHSSESRSASSFTNGFGIFTVCDTLQHTHKHIHQQT